MEQGTNPQQEILTYHFQFEVFFLESNNNKNYRNPYISTEHKNGRVQAPTFTWTATASSHTQYYKLI
jgi:hypothetical protein